MKIWEGIWVTVGILLFTAAVLWFYWTLVTGGFGWVS